MADVVVELKFNLDRRELEEVIRQIGMVSDKFGCKYESWEIK